MYGEQYASATLANRLPDDYRLLHGAELSWIERTEDESRPGKEPRLPAPGLSTKDRAWQAIYIPQL